MPLLRSLPKGLDHFLQRDGGDVIHAVQHRSELHLCDKVHVKNPEGLFETLLPTVRQVRVQLPDGVECCQMSRWTICLLIPQSSANGSKLGLRRYSSANGSP